VARAQQTGRTRLRCEKRPYQTGAGRDQDPARGVDALAHAQHAHRSLLQRLD